MSVPETEKQVGMMVRPKSEPPGLAQVVTTIRPPTRWPGLGLSEIWRYRRICLVLARRNLMVRYRQTAIGAAWVILQPLLLMLVFTVFFGVMARLPTEHLPFPVFYLLGLLPWMMVNKILTEGATSVVNNSSLVTRVYFPPIYFPTSVAIASLVDLAFGFVVLGVFLALFGIIPGVTLLVTPVLILIALITSLGVTYWLSALDVAYRDVTQMLPFLSTLWMFGSPIIYPSTIVVEPYRTWYWLNPISLVVEGFRWALGNIAPPPPEAWIIGVTVAVTLFVSGFFFFRYRERNFADHV